MELDSWCEKIKIIAEHPSIMCKISGLTTCDTHNHWHVDNFCLFIEHAIEIFGEDRIMFASDWPFCMQAATYDEVYESTMASLNLTEEQLGKFSGLNAAEFYKLRGN